MPHFITTTHHKGCNTCEVYALHIIEMSKALMVEILPREVKKAFCTAWPNIVCHIEDEASSESDKNVKWYSDHHDNLTDDIRLTEEKASVEQDCCQKADEKLVKANSKITELEPKLMSLQRSSLSCEGRTNKHQLIGVTHSISLTQNQRQPLADQAGKVRRGNHFPPPCNMGASSQMRPVHRYQLMS